MVRWATFSQLHVDVFPRTPRSVSSSCARLPSLQLIGRLTDMNYDAGLLIRSGILGPAVWNDVIFTLNEFV